MAILHSAAAAWYTKLIKEKKFFFFFGGGGLPPGRDHIHPSPVLSQQTSSGECKPGDIDGKEAGEVGWATGSH